MITAKFSPLKLEQFALLNTQYDFGTPKENEKLNAQELFQSYRIDVEFDHFFDDEETIRLFAKINVNDLKRPKRGYTLSATALGIFKLEDQGKTNKQLTDNLRFYSTLNMMINNLRNVMFQITNLGPLGGYLLPPIDILDLFKKKNKAAKAQS